jgi:alanine-alpha-ketoisovalerate/valine-pyruvate aminotransferase
VRTEVASKKVKKEIQDKISKATKGVCACGQLIKGKEENGVIKFPRTCNGCGNLLTKNSFKKITKI